ncbi:MAG: hypothetical protein P8179_16530 [Candidatus Thiodiazotropha sp.]
MVYSIFLHPHSVFDVKRIRQWLEARSDVLLDPLGSGIFMTRGLVESIDYMRDKRIKDPSRFGYCVLVTIKPDEINVFQEYGNDFGLTTAREFVKMIIDETGCKVSDEYGTDWTERVRHEGVGVLYPAIICQWRLARQLNGMREADFLSTMADEVKAGKCTVKSVNISGPPPQKMEIYEYEDGTVVWYKPLGDMRRPGPTYSMEVKKKPRIPYLKVGADGKAVSKNPHKAEQPYVPGTVQADIYMETEMNQGRILLIP